MKRGAHRARVWKRPALMFPLASVVLLVSWGSSRGGVLWASEQKDTARTAKGNRPPGVVRFRPNLSERDAGVKDTDGGMSSAGNGRSPALKAVDGGAGTSGLDAGAAASSSPQPSGASGKDEQGAGRDPMAEKYRPAVGSQILAREEVHVGDRVELLVSVIHEKGVTVNLPAGLSLHEDVKALKRQTREPEILDNGKVKQVFTLKLAPFKVGELELAPIRVIYTYPKDGASSGGAPAMAEVATEPLLLRVKSLMANEPSPKMKPNDAPVVVLEENRTLKIVLIVIGAVLAGILLGLLLFFLIRKRRRRPKPAPPPRPAHEVAFEKLCRLADSSLRDEERYADFYFGVSEAFREYLGNRYGFDSLEMTTTELMDAMAKVGPGELSLEELREFSEDCDLVKFAKYNPTRQEADDVLKAAFDMVERSKKPEAQKEAVAAGGDAGNGTVSSGPPGQDAGALEAGARKTGIRTKEEDSQIREDPPPPESPKQRDRKENESTGEEVEKSQAVDEESQVGGDDESGGDGDWGSTHGGDDDDRGKEASP